MNADYLKTPIYLAEGNFYKNAHILKNSHMCKLYQFFNPAPNQILVYGFMDSKPIADLLKALLYDVRWDDKMWTAYIPEHLWYQNRK